MLDTSLPMGAVEQDAGVDVSLASEASPHPNPLPSAVDRGSLSASDNSPPVIASASTAVPAASAPTSAVIETGSENSGSAVKPNPLSSARGGEGGGEGDAGSANPQTSEQPPEAASTALSAAPAPAAATAVAFPPKPVTTTASVPVPSQPMPDAPSGAGAVGSAVLALLLVVGLILALAWLAKRMPGAVASSNKSLRVVASLAVGQRERVVVVAVGDTQLLLGVGPGGTRTLHTLSEPLPVGDAPAPFAQLLSQHFGKKS